MHVCALLAHQPGLCPAQPGAADRLQITVRQHIWREVGRRPERATSFPKHTRGWACRGVRLGVPRSSPRLVRTGRQGLSARHRASSGCVPPGVACRSRPRTWMMLCVEDLRKGLLFKRAMTARRSTTQRNGAGPWGGRATGRTVSKVLTLRLPFDGRFKPQFLPKGRGACDEDRPGRKARARRRA